MLVLFLFFLAREGAGTLCIRSQTYKLYLAFNKMEAS
jgi:hypothetical protein